MEWAMFMRVLLARLLKRLREHERFYFQVRAVLLKYGFRESDPLVVEVETALRQVRGHIETVTARVAEYQPYRPGVDPWKNSGLAAHLRPDFKARGITGREEPPRHT